MIKRKSNHWKFLAWAMALFFFALSPLCVLGAGGADSEAAARLFATKVLGLLREKCFACHGEKPEKIKGELNMMTRAGMLKGGESGDAALVPGDAVGSLIYFSSTWADSDYEMPPKENDRLTEGQQHLLRDWINAGAPWPSEAERAVYLEAERSQASTAAGVIAKTSGGLSDEWTYRRYQEDDLWAFRPVERVAPPVVRGVNGLGAVDAFVVARQRAASIKGAGQADKRTLVRRAYQDLLGLAPTYEEIEAFAEDESDEAWGKLIDRLLGSEHYGERWGQHWLDAVRYADTSGFSNDYERSNAWRYRDYVIRSFNADKPYNDFIVEQIAGDELRPGDAEAQIATGFLRMGPWGTAMVLEDAARQAYLDDVVNGVGQSFLSITMRCFKCHDHKFDPLPTKDYYRMYAAFAGTQPAEMHAAFLDVENRGEFASQRKTVERLLGYAKAGKQGLYDKRETAAKKWYDEHGLDYVDAAARKNMDDDKKPARHVGLDYVDEGTLKVREQDEWIWNRRLERFEALAQSVYNGNVAATPNGRKLRPPAKNKVDKDWKPESFVLTGGSLESQGAEVRPGVLSLLGLAVEGASGDDLYGLTTELEGRRLGLARWIADDKNPLTARSIVNRVWQGHFGKGLCATANNFGVKGAKPTHPQLLDWLAGEFVRNGWSIKWLHRTMMGSAVYRQSVEHDEMAKLGEVDPENKLLAYFEPRRLTAEELRDGMLQVTGELNEEVGGLAVMPEINMEVALQPRMIQFSLAPSYEPSPRPEQRNRRTIYAYRTRGQADPFLEIFNLPNANESCEVRNAAAVTPQAFTLMNSEMVTDRSIAFALRVQKEAKTADGQIAQAFRLALGRVPDDVEHERLSDFYQEMVGYHQKHKPVKVEYPTRLTQSLVEEFSGRPFEYEEILPIFEDYTADKKAWEVGAEARALADVCLLLFNSNEFAYVY